MLLRQAWPSVPSVGGDHRLSLLELSLLELPLLKLPLLELSLLELSLLELSLLELSPKAHFLGFPDTQDDALLLAFVPRSDPAPE